MPCVNHTVEVLEGGPDCYGTFGLIGSRITLGRHVTADIALYELFRILPNAHQFENHGANTVAQPRGLPDDLSPELRKLVAWREGIGWQCHYASWLLLEELLQLPWEENEIHSNGLVDAVQHATSDENERTQKCDSAGDSSGVRDTGHNSLCSSIAACVLPFLRRPSFASLPSIAKNDGMDHPDGEDDLRSDAITKMVMGYSHAECCQVFLQRTVPLLKSIGQPDQVRIVFWF